MSTASYNFPPWPDLTDEQRQQRIHHACRGHSAAAIRRRIDAAMQAGRLTDDARRTLADLLLDGLGR